MNNTSFKADRVAFSGQAQDRYTHPVAGFFHIAVKVRKSRKSMQHSHATLNVKRALWLSSVKFECLPIRFPVD